MKLRYILVTLVVIVAIVMLLNLRVAGADVMTDTLAELTEKRQFAVEKLQEVQEQSAYIQRYILELNGGIATITSLQAAQEEVDNADTDSDTDADNE